MKNEKDLKNLKDLFGGLANCETEKDFRRTVGCAWGWLAMRAITRRESTVDEVAPAVLEAVEKFFDWDIPTMEEIEAEKDENNPPDED